MADLTTITNSPVPAPARLPALGVPELSVEYLAKMKEIIEVMLGRRGSDWDRAVTFRDLQNGGLGAYLPGGSVAQGSPAIFDPGTGTISVGGGAPVNIDAALRNSSAYKSLLQRIGSAEELANLPEIVRSQIDSALTDLARVRKAEIRTVENKIQTNQLSMASQLKEITASLEGVAAGVREFDSAYADTVRAVATRVEEVAAELAAGGGMVEVQEQLTAIADAVEGLKGQWSLKIQANPNNGDPPVIAGISLSVEDPIAGPGTSEMIFLAEAFRFLTESGSVQPFSIAGDIVTLLNIVMGAGGSFRQGQTAYDTGNGLFLGDIGNVDPALSMRAAGGKFVRIRPATDTFEASGLKLFAPDIDNPKLNTTFTVTISDLNLTNQISGSTITHVFTPTYSSGVGPYRNQFSFVTEGGIEMTSDPTGANATIRASSNTWVYGWLSVTSWDSYGASDTDSARIRIQFGSGAEP